jgi:molybdopterin/thiamine biosynthesis adenylyltransferase
MTGARYLRHNLIDWFSQDSLAKTKVAVVGAGAVGNEVIKNLALLGVGEIHVYDLDRIEEHNLTRSVLFRTSDIGEAKATVAARRASELDPNILVVPHHGDFWSALSLSALRSFDVLFCCVDNFEARVRCNSLCYLAGVDFVNTGIDSRYAVVELFPFSDTREAGCLECSLPATAYGRIAARYSCGHLRKVSFVERRIPTTIITSAAVGSLAVSRGLRFGAATDDRAAWRLYVDTISGAITRTELTRAESCPCCSRFGGKVSVVQSRPWLTRLATAEGAEQTVYVSDPILVGFRIAPSDKQQIVFERASSFTSDYPATLSQDPGAVSLDIRDQFTLGELAGQFAGYRMPCKFAIVVAQGRSTVFDFEGVSNERSESDRADG